MNGIFTVAGIAIISLGAIILLRQYKPEFAFGVSIAVGILLFVTVLGEIKDIFSEIKNWLSLSTIEAENYSVLFRCFGICVVTKITVQTCMDCKESSLASKVDLFGKISILVLALPLFSELLEIVQELIG